MWSYPAAVTPPSRPHQAIPAPAAPCGWPPTGRTRRAWQSGRSGRWAVRWSCSSRGYTGNIARLCCLRWHRCWRHMLPSWRYTAVRRPCWWAATRSRYWPTTRHSKSCSGSYRSAGPADGSPTKRFRMAYWQLCGARWRTNRRPCIRWANHGPGRPRRIRSQPSPKRAHQPNSTANPTNSPNNRPTPQLRRPVGSPHHSTGGVPFSTYRLSSPEWVARQQVVDNPIVIHNLTRRTSTDSRP